MRTLLAWLLLLGTSQAATYYVDVATGSNADTGLSESLAFADPGYAAQQMGDGDICYVKSGTYTVTTVTLGAGGPVKFAQASLRARMEGYSATPGDRCVGGSKPIVSADAALNPAGACNLVEAAGTINEPHLFIALRADANSEPNTTCFKGASTASAYNSYFIECEAVEAAADGFNAANCIRCYAGSNGAEGFDSVIPSFCYAESNTSAGFTLFGNAINCIARANGTGGINAGIPYSCINCAAYGNTTYGINCSRNNILVNCVAVSNGDDGFETLDHTSLINCADYNNTQGRVATTPMLDQGAITLTGDPFVDAANDDFTPDNTASQGALLRAAGINPYGHTGYLDVGAVQHQDPASNVIDPLTGTIGPGN